MVNHSIQRVGESSVVRTTIEYEIRAAIPITVEEEDVLMILESMKMEIPVHATEDGTVTHVLLENGQGVSAGQALVVIESSQ